MARITVFIISLFFVFTVFAQGPKPNRPHPNMPKPLFKQPVKVDRSGRPLYNTWQKQEHERKIRFEQRQMIQDDSGKVSPNDPSNTSLYKTNAATSETSTTPSSAITNRPIQTQDDSGLGNEETDEENR